MGHIFFVEWDVCQQMMARKTQKSENQKVRNCIFQCGCCEQTKRLLNTWIEYMGRLNDFNDIAAWQYGLHENKTRGGPNSLAVLPCSCVTENQRKGTRRSSSHMNIR